MTASIRRIVRVDHQCLRNARDRDNPGGQSAFVVFPSRARGRHLSASQTPRATPRTTNMAGDRPEDPSACSDAVTHA